MTNLIRIQELLKFVEEEPSNPFNYFALALEYQIQDKKQAKYYFDKLLTEHPAYLPTYYHAASFFTQFEEIEKARGIYLKGIELAIKEKNHHAKKELENAYFNFQLEHE